MSNLEIWLMPAYSPAWPRAAPFSAPSYHKIGWNTPGCFNRL